MEDMPIGELARMVEEIESSPTSIADHFGLCPDCGAKLGKEYHSDDCPWHDRQARADARLRAEEAGYWDGPIADGR